jgi:hypothetical protein
LNSDNVRTFCHAAKLGLLPAAIPATCVPCSQPSIELGQLTPEPEAVEDATPPGQKLAVSVPFVE